MLEGMAANPQNLTTWQAEYGGARRPFSVVLVVFALLAALLLAAAPSDIGETVAKAKDTIGGMFERVAEATSKALDKGREVGGRAMEIVLDLGLDRTR